MAHDWENAYPWTDSWDTVERMIRVRMEIRRVRMFEKEFDVRMDLFIDDCHRYILYMSM